MHTTDLNNWDMSPLRQPLWWFALAVLLVNDYGLKGSGVAPGWLTGKLSDFAFIVVAPVVLAALLPKRLPARRSIAVCVVSAVFVATELSPALSERLIAAVAQLGLRWKLWPDPTDLLALLALPCTLWVLRAQAPTQTSRRTLLRERFALAAGAAACLATSSQQQPARPLAPECIQREEEFKALNKVNCAIDSDCQAVTYLREGCRPAYVRADAAAALQAHFTSWASGVCGYPSDCDELRDASGALPREPSPAFCALGTCTGCICPVRCSDLMLHPEASALNCARGNGVCMKSADEVCDCAAGNLACHPPAGTTLACIAACARNPRAAPSRSDDAIPAGSAGHAP